jgi:hemerythrin-like domain-containing protein
MLAAGSAWRILEAEHHQLRQLLEAIGRNLGAGAGKHPPARLESLRTLIREFQDFEIETHRPKGVVLLGSVRGRLAEADRLLDEIDDESRQCEQLLEQALSLIDQLESRGDPDRRELVSLLGRHRELMLRQLDQEDTALRSYTAQLLTSQEWSRVVSSISREVQKDARGRRTRGSRG